MTEKLRILLAEDHLTVREGIKLLVNAQADMEVVGEAENGEVAIKEAVRLTPDMVIMDVSMPVLNGLKATKRLRRLCPDIMILTLSRHSDDGYLQQLINAGANGYVLKQSAPKELINAIRAVGAGKAYLDPALTQKVMGGYAVRSTSLRGEGKKELSSREIEVIKLIAFGYSNKEIAARLDLSVKTVEAHKANAMRKLGISGRIDIVKYAILQNWLQDN
ncbi:MAG: response regulator transcription factor [Acidobacteria bacterium]|nr:response regulator transcription factor [Acidobacteriota bacterium]